MIRVGTENCRHRVCPLCGRDNRDEASSSWSQGEWSIKTCGSCSLVFLENVLPYESLVTDHAWTRSSALRRNEKQHASPMWYAVSGRLNEIRWKVTRRDKVGQLVRTYIRSGTVLDIGCGRGEVLATLDAAFVPWGIEIDEEAVGVARRRLSDTGGRILHADALGGLRQLDDGCLDGVVMISYLEHENEPLAVLRETRRTLRQGGSGIIKVPNFGCLNRVVRGNRWCGFRHPDHVNYFTPATLEQMVQLSGLNVRRFWFNDRLPTSDNMWMVVQKGCSADGQQTNSHRAI